MHFRELVDNNGPYHRVFYTISAAFSENVSPTRQSTTGHAYMSCRFKLSCNAVYRTLMVVQKARVGQLEILIWP